MVTRHLIFVGYSLRDTDFVSLAQEVAQILRDRGASYTEIGTVLALTPPSQPAHDWERDLRTVPLGDDIDDVSPGEARILEVFLDRMAWRSARTESSWILDERYGHLLADAPDRDLAEVLRGLQVPHSAKWDRLRRLLSDYGRRDNDRD